MAVTREECVEFLSANDLIFWDDCDAALIGVGSRCAEPDVTVYDYGLLVDCFVSQGMTEEEAVEWVSYNIEGAWVGPQTPIILRA
jgi:hypothetical protein